MIPWAVRTQSEVLFGFVAVVFIGVLIGFNFPLFPIRADELHFWPTSLWLFHDGIPSVERLRSYNELSTPLPFLVFGGLEQVFHGGIADDGLFRYCDARRVIDTRANDPILALVVVACLRFRPSSLGGLMLYANAINTTGAHLALDKYALPLLTVLWLLKSADRLDMKSASEWETSVFAMAK